MESIVIADLDQISLDIGLKIKRWILEDDKWSGIGAHNDSSPSKTESMSQLNHDKFAIKVVPTYRNAADDKLKQMLSRKLKRTHGPIHIILVTNDKSFRNDILEIYRNMKNVKKLTYLNSHILTKKRPT